MPKQLGQKKRAWYVLHTYSGYEENVASNLRQRIESMDMEEKIFNVMVPKEKKIKIKNHGMWFETPRTSKDLWVPAQFLLRLKKPKFRN